MAKSKILLRKQAILNNVPCPHGFVRKAYCATCLGGRLEVARKPRTGKVSTKHSKATMWPQAVRIESNANRNRAIEREIGASLSV